jgi:hypothetical protein
MFNPEEFGDPKLFLIRHTMFSLHAPVLNQLCPGAVKDDLSFLPEGLLFHSVHVTLVA